MEVDAVGSGVMKTPTIPDSEEPTVELLKDQTLRIVKEMEEEEEKTAKGDTLELGRDTLAEGTIALERELREDETLSLEQKTLADQTLSLEQEKIVAEAEKELLQIQEEEAKTDAPMVAKEEQPYEEQFIPTPIPAERGKPPLLLGGILVILILGALGYFFLFPSEKPSAPAVKKIAATKKKAVSRKPTAKEELSALKPGEIPATKATEPAKPEPAPPAAAGQPVAARKPEMPKPAPEVKQPVTIASKEVPPVKAETPKLQGVPPVPAQPQSPIPRPEPVPAKPQVMPQKPQPVSPKPEAVAKPVESAKSPLPPIALEARKSPPEKPDLAMVALPAPTEQGRYSIHVGSFKQKENADEIVGRLRKKGYPVLCNLADIPGKGELYRVKVGYYANGTEAKQVAKKLKTVEKVFTLVLQR
jgi:cell division septation protein DedD